MSENILKIISTIPDYVPDSRIIDDVEKLLTDHFIFAEDISIEITDEVRFIDQGANFEEILCPHCKQPLDDQWWKIQMDAAYRKDFHDLAIKSPCCKNQTSLNELMYVWPAGFARFSIEIRSPSQDIDANFIRVLEGVLGTTLKEIWAHY
jgi:hypothetical protein